MGIMRLLLAAVVGVVVDGLGRFQRYEVTVTGSRTERPQLQRKSKLPVQKRVALAIVFSYRSAVE